MCVCAHCEKGRELLFSSSNSSFLLNYLEGIVLKIRDIDALHEGFYMQDQLILTPDFVLNFLFVILKVIGFNCTSELS